ncbi:unnamed protein product [Amoebophrya sp. A25]|nr:unnamed protein product [Amoebophrya sp. A25]|eukprot:GSA25T00026867001.1
MSIVSGASGETKKRVGRPKRGAAKAKSKVSPKPKPQPKPKAKNAAYRKRGRAESNGEQQHAGVFAVAGKQNDDDKAKIFDDEQAIREDSHAPAKKQRTSRTTNHLLGAGLLPDVTQTDPVLRRARATRSKGSRDSTKSQQQLEEPAQDNNQKEEEEEGQQDEEEDEEEDIYGEDSIPDRVVENRRKAADAVGKGEW